MGREKFVVAAWGMEAGCGCDVADLWSLVPWGDPKNLFPKVPPETRLSYLIIKCLGLWWKHPETGPKSIGIGLGWFVSTAPGIFGLASSVLGGRSLKVFRALLAQLRRRGPWGWGLGVASGWQRTNIGPEAGPVRQTGLDRCGLLDDRCPGRGSGGRFGPSVPET
jgi:hypothetical protein